VLVERQHVDRKIHAQSDADKFTVDVAHVQCHGDEGGGEPLCSGDEPANGLPVQLPRASRFLDDIGVKDWLERCKPELRCADCLFWMEWVQGGGDRRYFKHLDVEPWYVDHIRNTIGDDVLPGVRKHQWWLHLRITNF